MLRFKIGGIVNDGSHALELVWEERPHRLITDIRMLGCDGIELIYRANELQPSLNFIIINGYQRFECAQSVLEYGIDDYKL